MPLIVEVRTGGEWLRMGEEIRPGDQDGSFSHNGPAGRQIYSFGCRGDHSLLMRSQAGFDYEIGAMRAIGTEGFEEIARLTPDEPRYECWLKTDRMSQPMRVRFTHT